jgi:hypothetical protein
MLLTGIFKSVVWVMRNWFDNKQYHSIYGTYVTRSPEL